MDTPIKYYSTNKQSPTVSFREATIKGQAPDKGLYFPDRIPQFREDVISNFRNLTKEELAYLTIRPYIGGDIPDSDLYKICEETVNFDFPLVPVTDSISSLELFHGPTLAFKDIGARFMSRCLGYFSQEKDQKVTVLVATSGDTGSAVAAGFLGVEGVDVVILYPSGKVSKVQEQQLTTLGQNITALEVQGTFDDCQAMVKQAFADTELTSRIFVTPTIIHLAFVLMSCAFTLVPSVDRLALGAGMGVAGIVFLGYAGRNVFHIGRRRAVEWSDHLWYGICPLAAYIVVIVGAVRVLQEKPGGVETIALALRAIGGEAAAPGGLGRLHGDLGPTQEFGRLRR